MATQAARDAARFQTEIQSIADIKARIQRLPFSGCSRREALTLASFLIDHAAATEDKQLKAEYARLSIRAWQVARRCPSC